VRVPLPHAARQAAPGGIAPPAPPPQIQLKTPPAPRNSLAPHAIVC
jgi:hypothetical protein